MLKTLGVEAVVFPSRYFETRCQEILQETVPEAIVKASPRPRRSR
jgi:hypothetical protein